MTGAFAGAMRMWICADKGFVLSYAMIQALHWHVPLGGLWQRPRYNFPYFCNAMAVFFRALRAIRAARLTDVSRL